MTLKEMRKALSEQITLVKENADNIPQAEVIANLSGKMIKSIQLQISAEMMKLNGQKLPVFEEVL